MDRPLTKSQIEKVDTALAAWVFSKGLAFNVITDRSLHDQVLCLLNSTYTERSTISAWTLRYRFLVQQDEDINDKVRSAVAHAAATCLFDHRWMDWHPQATCTERIPDNTDPIPAADYSHR